MKPNLRRLEKGEKGDRFQQWQDLRFYHEETNRKGRKVREGIRVLESSCVIPEWVGASQSEFTF